MNLSNNVSRTTHTYWYQDQCRSRFVILLFINRCADFPKPGIMFRDISGLLAAPVERELAYDLLAKNYEGKNITAVAGMVRIIQFNTNI